MALNTFAFLKKEKKKDFGGEFEQAEMALIETKFFFVEHSEEMANENSAWFFGGSIRWTNIVSSKAGK
jgi:hypothetical protein